MPGTDGGLEFFETSPHGRPHRGTHLLEASLAHIDGCSLRLVSLAVLLFLRRLKANECRDLAGEIHLDFIANLDRLIGCHAQGSKCGLDSMAENQKRRRQQHEDSPDKCRHDRILWTPTPHMQTPDSHRVPFREP